ncbi:MAG: STAS domain-containing protein [Verrucomicrobiota bacterium JB023]|nr:STAS domain-containing protein [Verrucomicrobiota bacterium JB023]
MTKESSIEVGEVEGSQWVRVHGKGNFVSSPGLKECVEKRLGTNGWDGKPTVVVDLDECPAMDSTFMGTLAGLALQLSEQEGRLAVVGLSERNRDSLSDLGLDALLDLEDEDGGSDWDGRLGEIRSGLQQWDGRNKTAAAAEEVLEAHRKLCDVDDRNVKKFGAVLDVLERECEAKGPNS